MSTEHETNHLDKSLGPLMIWGLGVGYVISGEYFGWNLGLAEGGPYGMLVATLIVTLMYLCFTLSYAELACALPGAGGAYVYGREAYGERFGLTVGLAQLIEFVFAPPAIAFAIGSYLQSYLPSIPVLYLAGAAYLVFTGLNAWGVKLSAIFELVMTVFAVTELLIFCGVTLPEFQWSQFSQNPLPNGWWGILPSLPFAIWFYLALEGIANIAEEARNPQRDISRGFIYALITLVTLALLVFFASVGVAGWEAVVYTDASQQTSSDSPLPLAIAHVVGEGHLLYHLLVTVGLFGLIASFHGIILVAGRATMEFGRVGYLPKLLGQIHAQRKTPINALILNMLIGFIALLTGKTGEIITLACFGALSLYALSMLSLLKLRQNQPELDRPYKAPFYPMFPIIALCLAVLCLAAVSYYNLTIALIYVGLLGLGYLLGQKRIA